MTIVAIHHFRDKATTPSTVHLVIGDEDPWVDAIKLFKKHIPDSDIFKMEIVSGNVINAWAQ